MNLTAEQIYATLFLIPEMTNSRFDAIKVMQAYHKAYPHLDTPDWHKFSTLLDILYRARWLRLVGHNSNGMAQYRIAS